MRITPFREILHSVAFKLGLDPTQSNFLTNQAIPIGTYINQWVTRLYTDQDWPEWTLTKGFYPDASHIVPWDAISAATGEPVKLGRVLKVYLVDPNTTDAPISTRYTEQSAGIHCGFEHGSQVWIKFLAPAPEFTAVQWDPQRIFQKDDVTYSYTTGEVYRSKVSGNVGHDPSYTFSPPPHFDIPQPPIPLSTDLTVPLVADGAGTAVQTQIIKLTAQIKNPAGSDGVPLPNPLPNLAQIYISVFDPVGGTQLAAAVVTTNGVDTLDITLTDLANQLISGLGGGWDVQVDTGALTITISNPSGFTISGWWYSPLGGPISYLLLNQLQTYIPATAPTAGTKQEIVFSLTPENVTPGAMYELKFKDVSGNDHIVVYEATAGDGAEQILSALVNLANQASTNDPFFNDVASDLDLTSLQATFKTSTKISIGAEETLPGSAYWQLEPFPSTISIPVIRGAYGDLLREWGQADKAGMEEAKVPEEEQNAMGDFEPTPNPPLTGQSRARSRYKMA